jgi:hypothetical protein
MRNSVDALLATQIHAAQHLRTNSRPINCGKDYCTASLNARKIKELCQVVSGDTHRRMTTIAIRVAMRRLKARKGASSASKLSVLRLRRADTPMPQMESPAFE